MRSLRWLLLIAIAVIAAGVFQKYRYERLAGKAAQRPAPPMMSRGDKATAKKWEWGQSADGRPAVELSADDYKLAADSKTAQLEGIELRIYQKSGKSYDRVRSDHADFSTDDKKLFAPGDAEITLDVPAEGEPKHPLTSIKAAKVNFDSQTGEAHTDQHVSFEFDGGSGVCEGAAYNPQTHEIHLLHGVALNLKSKNPGGLPMKVETDELIYSEAAATVVLGPWSRMTRDQNVMVAGTATVKLRAKKLDTIEAPAAHGTDKQAGKDLEYSADLVRAQYNDQGEMEKLDATGNARLVSRSKASETTMTGARLNLSFTTTPGNSVLSSAQARGNAFLESKPAVDPKGLTPDTKKMQADAIDIFMKPDGKELDRVTTLGPGTLEFLPNQAARSRRQVKADRILVRYGANNEIQTFHADAASTETHPSQEDVAKKRKPANDIASTSSKTLDAAFDDRGQLKTIRQEGNFRYAEGVRKAQADTGMLDNAKNVMDLDAHARMADDTGSTTANHIQIDQATGDFDARGGVATTRLPDQKPDAPEQKPAAADAKTNQPDGKANKADAKSSQKDQGGGMLDPGEAMQGKADHVMSASRGRVVHYIDNAVVWQGASRIQADHIDIDRDHRMLTAEGNVVSQLQDNNNAATPPPGGKSAVPVMTLVRSQKMVYTDTNRLAVYMGGVTLLRAGLTVKSVALQAYMNDGKPVDGKTPDSRIDRALADGKVEIVQIATARQRVGTGEHGEYYTDEGKVILTGGSPQLKDSVKGDAAGEKLTYYTGDDRLLINGKPQKQVAGHIVRGKS